MQKGFLFVLGLLLLAGAYAAHPEVTQKVNSPPTPALSSL